MKKYICALLLLPVLASAEPQVIQKKVVCDEVSSMLLKLTTEYGENPIWLGKGLEGDNSVMYGLTVNSETGSWSFIEYNETVSCLLGDGNGFKISPNAVEIYESAKSNKKGS